MSTPSRTALFVAAVALALTACSGGGGTDTLQANLDAQNQALEALRGRVTDLTDRVDEFRTVDVGAAVTELSDQVEGMLARMETLEGDLTQVAEDARSGEDLEASVATDIGALQEQVGELTASLQSLTASLAAVRDSVDALQRDFEQHADDPFAHNRQGQE